MNKVLSIIFLLSIFIMVSCGSDSPATVPDNNNNNNNESSDFFPLGIGSWWKYKTSYDLTSDDYSIDSTALVGKKLVNGKESYEFIRYIKDKDSKEIISQSASYYYKEGPVIYSFMLNDVSGVNEWILYADINKDYLSLLNTPLTDFKKSANSTFTGIYKMERFIDGPEKLYLDKDTINCLKTRFIISWTGEMTTNGITEEYNNVFTEYQWFGYGAGLVRLFWDNDEYDQTLIDYYLAPTEE